MIQELFAMVDERKFCMPGGLDVSSPSSLSSSSSSSMSNSSSTPLEPQQNLRCPRCDSPNTKFCYYNNYNLTQPRHFCKTCRRYWTKGGALRNVPIGGGCRKVKPSPALAAACRSGSMRVKPTTSSNDVTVRPGNGSSFDHHELPSSPVLWGASPYSSQLLDLLRASQFQNPNASPATIFNLNSMRIKEDGGAVVGSIQTAEPVYTMGEQGFGLDSLGQLTVLPCNWRNGANHQYHQHQQLQIQQQQQQQQHNMLVGEMQSSGIQELLQRLRSSANYNVGNQLPSMSTNACSAAASLSSTAVTTSAVATSTANSILEPLQLSNGDVGGYWNPASLSWADLSAANGAFH